MLLFSLYLISQTTILNESFTDPAFPPSGWDTLYAPTMTSWYRYTYSTANPDSFQARQRVYDAADTLRTGYSILATIPLDLSASVGTESLFFWYRFSLASGNLGPDDTLFIDIGNNDTSWTPIMKIGPATATNDWDTAQIDLAGYDSYANARIRFRYEDRPNGLIGTTNCNFWLDSIKVVSYFTDTLPPHVASTSPARGDTGIGVASSIYVTFDEAIDPATVTSAAFTVTGASSGPHAGTATYPVATYTAQFDPGVDFAYGELVTVTVHDSIRDLAGNILDGDENGTPGGDYIFSFSTTASPDTTPPAAVTDLACVDTGASFVKLRWTAPGDDGNAGRASQYDIRYAAFAINAANFPTATPCPGAPLPAAAGALDSLTVGGLDPQTRYYFALITADEELNWSPISNVPSCSTETALETLIVLNEFLPDPATFDHDDDGDYGDADEEFIELFNADVRNIAIGGYTISDYIGGNALALPSGTTIPAFGYALLYASGEYLIITGDMDTLAGGDWNGTWPTLDQGADTLSDTLVLRDAGSNELDRKAFASVDVLPDFSFARLPNGSETWINNAFPTPGSSNGTSYVWPIAVALKDADSNFVPDLLDSVVTIAGVVTAPPYVYSASEAYIQDNTGGVCLYGNFPIYLDAGDSLVVTGSVNQYRGKSEISDFTYQRLKTGCPLPEPVQISGAVANTEAYEGMIVRLGVASLDGFLLEDNADYTAWDNLGTPFTLWIDSYTDIPGNLAPLDTFTITGIKGQYSYNSVPDDGYQIMPRDTSDFSHLFVMPAIRPIADVQQPGDDGVTPRLLDSIVAVEGVITGPNYVFTSGSPSVYLQDASAGVNVYDADGAESFLTYIDTLGARLRLIGTVTEYNGLTEIARGYGWFVTRDTVPAPRQLNPNRFITEGMEGMLITFRGTVVTAPYQSGDGYNLEVMNGDCGIAVRYPSSAGISPTEIKVGDRRTFTGIAGQYDPEPPYTSGYQVLLRFPGDAEIVSDTMASSEPQLVIDGPTTFLPGEGEHGTIQINSPPDYTLRLDVHDMTGRIVRNLYQGAGGPHEITWDGRNETGQPCPIGIYLLNLHARAPGSGTEFRRGLIVIGTRF